MIKPGDKVICIKDYSYTNNDNLTHSFSIGKEYEIVTVGRKNDFILKLI
jgi:PDZ domain-containing secreted protein